MAQQRPVAAMFADDQKRGETIALSFSTTEVAPSKTVDVPLQVYLTGGDLARAFDIPAFRPGAAIVPTNTDLAIAASPPATQAVLIERVRRQPDVMRDLQAQIAARRAQPRAPAGEPGLLRIGADIFVAQLPRPGVKQSGGAFPRAVCLIATNFAQGGEIDRRELLAQDRLRKGIAGCLAALDASGIESIVVPLMGAASSSIQANDPAFEGQRVLKGCRLLNSLAGIAWGFTISRPAAATSARSVSSSGIEKSLRFRGRRGERLGNRKAGVAQGAERREDHRGRRRRQLQRHLQRAVTIPGPAP